MMANPGLASFAANPRRAAVTVTLHPFRAKELEAIRDITAWSSSRCLERSCCKRPPVVSPGGIGWAVRMKTVRAKSCSGRARHAYNAGRAPAFDRAFLRHEGAVLGQRTLVNSPTPRRSGVPCCPSQRPEGTLCALASVVVKEPVGPEQDLAWVAFSSLIIAGRRPRLRHTAPIRIGALRRRQRRPRKEAR